MFEDFLDHENLATMEPSPRTTTLSTHTVSLTEQMQEYNSAPKGIFYSPQDVLWEGTIELNSCPADLRDKTMEVLYKHTNMWRCDLSKVKDSKLRIQ